MSISKSDTSPFCSSSPILEKFKKSLTSATIAAILHQRERKWLHCKITQRTHWTSQMDDKLHKYKRMMRFIYTFFLENNSVFFIIFCLIKSFFGFFFFFFHTGSECPESCNVITIWALQCFCLFVCFKF